MTYLLITRAPPFRPLIGGEYDYARKLAEILAVYQPVRGLTLAYPGVEPPQSERIQWTMVPHAEPHRLKSLLSPLPNVAFRNESPALLEAAVAAAQDADAVFVDFIAMYWLVEPLVRRLATMERPPPVIAISHNHEYAVRRQMLAAEPSLLTKLAIWVDTEKAGRMEIAAQRAAGGLAVHTRADGDAFIKTAPSTPQVVMTPGYDGPSRKTPRVLGPDVPARVCILGNHGAHHKKMVLSRALDALVANGTDRGCIVDVVGSGGHEELAVRYPSINFKGFVEDIDDYLANVRIGLLPDEIGGGFKNRALMYAANRVPMMAVNSAMDGMGFDSGVHFAGSRNVDEMAKAIPALLEDFATLNALQEHAFDHIRTAYNWAERGRDLHAFAQGLRQA
jgi:hypothetical protein